MNLANNERSEDVSSYDEKKNLIDSANGQFCSVTFIKKDGTRRVMTIQPAKLKFEVKGDDASESAKQGAATRKANNPHLHNVWSVDAKAIRSVNLDTVEQIKVGGEVYAF